MNPNNTGDLKTFALQLGEDYSLAGRGRSGGNNAHREQTDRLERFREPARGVAGSRRMEATTPHFVLYGNLSAEDLRARALKRLEQFDAVLRKLLNVGDSPRVEVYYLEAEGSGGPVSRQSERCRFLQRGCPARLCGRAPRNPRLCQSARRIHATPGPAARIHAPHDAQQRERHDARVGTGRVGGNVRDRTRPSRWHITVGLADTARVDILRELDRFTVLRALNSDDHPPKTDEDMAGRYAASWAMIHYLWFSGERAGQYANSSGN